MHPTIFNIFCISIHPIRILLRFYFVFFMASAFSKGRNIEITSPLSNEIVMIKMIQDAIDKRFSEGGGIVHLSIGVFLSGSLTLKSNVSLRIDKGCILHRSANIDVHTSVDYFHSFPIIYPVPQTGINPI
jgi:hypothetical protein